MRTKDDKKHLVLVKRSDDAKTNPGAHSGFFGWANNDQEKLNPQLIAHRELLEEVFIISRDKKKAFNLVLEENIDWQKMRAKIKRIN